MYLKKKLVSSNTLSGDIPVSGNGTVVSRSSRCWFLPRIQPARMPRPNNSVFRNPSVAVALLVVDTFLMIFLLVNAVVVVVMLFVATPPLYTAKYGNFLDPTLKIFVVIILLVSLLLLFARHKSFVHKQSFCLFFCCYWCFDIPFNLSSCGTLWVLSICPQKHLLRPALILSIIYFHSCAHLTRPLLRGIELDYWSSTPWKEGCLDSYDSQRWKYEECCCPSPPPSLFYFDCSNSSDCESLYQVSK